MKTHGLHLTGKVKCHWPIRRCRRPCVPASIIAGPLPMLVQSGDHRIKHKSFRMFGYNFVLQSKRHWALQPAASALKPTHGPGAATTACLGRGGKKGAQKAAPPTTLAGAGGKDGRG